jgi:hypothetical protein
VCDMLDATLRVWFILLLFFGSEECEVANMLPFRLYIQVVTLPLLWNRSASSRVLTLLHEIQ